MVTTLLSWLPTYFSYPTDVVSGGEYLGTKFEDQLAKQSVLAVLKYFDLKIMISSSLLHINDIIVTVTMIL